ncbi:MAG TPA: tetratricopeptide repeat protein [Acidobacteriota bacterium]|nr:tetratricopeptide repeat protein [Acidobacteriota bacterium]
MTRGLVRSIVQVMFVLLLLPWTLSAQAGQGSKGSGDTGSGSRKSTPNQPAIGSQPDLSRRTQQVPQVLFIAGAVVQEDGSPPPMGAVIKRTCSRRVFREANVDSTGHFSFQVGGMTSETSVLPDASDDSFSGQDLFGGRGSRMSGLAASTDPRSPANLMGCELRAELPGYQSSTIILTASSLAGNLDVGTIVVYPMSRVQGTMVSATNMGAPKTARKAMDRAQKAFQKHNYKDAELNLQTAVDAYPKFAAAWQGLGEVYEHTQRVPDAREAYSKALAADDRYVRPYISLAHLAVLEQQWQEAADLTDRGLTLDPLDFPEGHFFNSLANYNLNRLDAAERSARKAQRLDSRHLIPQSSLILANILEKKLDVQGAIAQLQDYLKYAQPSANTEKARAQLETLLQRSAQAQSAAAP